MKKWMMLLVSGLAAIVLSGCGSYEEGYHDGERVPTDGMVTLFLMNYEGFWVEGVPYYCVDPSGAKTAEFITAPNGEFSFIPGERCTFDLLGFGGTPDAPLFIRDDIGFGKGDIPYFCNGGDSGLTYTDGGFEYLSDDICRFYF
jgi:hypothetical protein